MEFVKSITILTDGSKAYNLHVKDGKNQVVFHCVDMEAAEDLANTLDNATVDFVITYFSD